MRPMNMFLLFIVGFLYPHQTISSYKNSPYQLEDNSHFNYSTSFAQQSKFVSPPLLWQASWSYSLEGITIGLLISLMARHRMLHNKRLFSNEKLEIVLYLIQRTQTPLSLIQRLLEDIDSNELPEATSKKMKKILRYTNHVINCHQNIITLDKIKGKIYPDTSNNESDLSTFINTVTNQCRIYANARQIEFRIIKDFNCIKCQINETVMNAALQCLLNKIIDVTPCNGCIEITVSQLKDYWNMKITNYAHNELDNRNTNSLNSVPMPVYCCGSLRSIKKIVHLHGGKLSGNKHGKAICFQIQIPIHCPCKIKKYMVTEKSETGNNGAIYPTNTNSSKQIKLIHKASKLPHILLVMSDKEFSNYLCEALTTFYQVTLLEEPDKVYSFACQKGPDTIIIDEIINGTYGNDLCIQIKSNTEMSDTPIILLLNKNIRENYLTYINSGADRLEPRTVSIYALQADIQILIKKRIAQQNKIKKLLSDTTLINHPEDDIKDDENALFLKKVEMLLEKNLSTEKYNVDILGLDMGMSRTGFYNKMKEITGKPPANYMLTYKMAKARAYLLEQTYSIGEISTMLGYCDAKYFSKKFKDFYHVSPTRLLKNTLG